MKVYLLPHGAEVDVKTSLDLLRDGDQILLRAGGKPRVRSDSIEAEQTPTRRIKLSAKVLGLSQLDSVEQTACVDLLLISQWVEVCLQGIDESKVDWDLAWCPRLELGNSMDSSEVGPEFGDSRSTSLDPTTGTITYVAHWRGSLSQVGRLRTTVMFWLSRLIEQGASLNRMASLTRPMHLTTLSYI